MNPSEPRRELGVFDLVTIDGVQYIDGRRSHPEAMLCSTRVFFYPPKPLYVPPESKILDTLERGKWVAEPKLDGRRLLVLHAAGEEVRAWTRKARPIVLPDPVREAVLATFPKWTLGDCVWISKTVQLFLLDLVAIEARFLADERLLDRKMAMLDLMTMQSGESFALCPWRSVEKLAGGIRSWYEEQLQHGHRGMVLKEKSARWIWRPDRSQVVHCWLKVRPFTGF